MDVSALVVGVGTAVGWVLAQNPPPPEQGPEFGKASPIALVVIILLGVATVLLIRSMNRHLKRVPAQFDQVEGGKEAGPRQRKPGSGDDGAPVDGETAASTAEEGADKRAN